MSTQQPSTESDKDQDQDREQVRDQDRDQDQDQDQDQVHEVPRDQLELQEPQPELQRPDLPDPHQNKGNSPSTVLMKLDPLNPDPAFTDQETKPDLDPLNPDPAFTDQETKPDLDPLNPDPAFTDQETKPDLDPLNPDPPFTDQETKPDLDPLNPDPPFTDQETKPDLTLVDPPPKDFCRPDEHEPDLPFTDQATRPDSGDPLLTDPHKLDQGHPQGPDPAQVDQGPDQCFQTQRTRQGNQSENQQDPPDPDPQRPPEPTSSGFLDQAPPPPKASQTSPLTLEPRPSSASSGELRLCGYLMKRAGPLRAWKQRWFTYEEKKNQLFYYRTPQDVTPLGLVDLSAATFTYPLQENGTFHIRTPERTFILKAVNQELMLYWLQQLQVKRWRHRQMSTGADPTNNNNNNTTDDFLPLLQSPVGLVGEEAAKASSQRTPLTNVSIKHPLIEIQNSVHSRRKRSSQDWSQSVFHVEAPPWTELNSADTDTTSRTTSGTGTTTSTGTTTGTTTSTGTTTGTRTRTTTSTVTTTDTGTTTGTGTITDTRTSTGTSNTPPEPHTPTEPSIPLADPGLTRSTSVFDRKSKSRGSSTLPSLRRDSVWWSERTSRLQQEKTMLMEEVKAQKELVWLLHKALEAAQLEKRTCAEFVAAEGEQTRLELLRHRERQAANLQNCLEEVKAEAEALRRSVAQKDTQLTELQNQIRILTEKNHAKQEVIVKLSDHMTTCTFDPRRSVCESSDTQNFSRLQEEIENLKDDIEAYKTQNKFLNSEIYQLTKLWRTSSEQEKSLMMKCAYLEASNCQVESQYLGVLKKLQETKSLDPAQRRVIQKMIEDALKGELKNVIKHTANRDYDEYGFKIIPDYEVEDVKLLAKIQALEIRSNNLLHQEGVEHPLLSRWAQYLAGRSEDDLCPSPELKGLLRGGVPHEYRPRVWRWVVRARTRTIREHHPQRYQQLCEKSRTSPHPASRQIQLDLHRTLTTNQHFSSPSSPTHQQLRRILLAFSWQNPVIGYCQGLNRLAAIALLVLQSEEDAFWCLVAVVETIMPQDYYTKNLVASQADQRVLKEFMAEKLPRLASHFDEHSIDVSLVTFNWFLVVFVESLPCDILLPLWDAFLYEGTKVIFRYALALFKYKEDDILKIHDSVEIYQYLRFFTKTISDGRRLMNIAFSDMNPFPGRLLRNRRALYLERLQGELRELEQQQREFVTEGVERKDKELDNMVSEDDDDL
ncbi:TBC1 domain family member 2A [Sphaeramia orbicularis]|uniref:TBC1 domain family member 2A n=1 Tax=Sphaeramia orbicularis TaxID=375764 RepID=UPI00117C9769|nr:TBC1 domain family member 2A-like [Sphaeramia orbicularis]